MSEEATEKSVWTDRIINILLAIIPISAIVVGAVVTITSNDTAMLAKMDMILSRLGPLEKSVSKILTEQATIKANLQNYTDRVKKLEDQAAFIGVMGQRINNLETRINRAESDINNIRNQRLLHKTLNSD